MHSRDEEQSNCSPALELSFLVYSPTRQIKTVRYGNLKSKKEI